jgi:protein-S-isoprenylcysteine O-methyltransferase Ste14
MMPGVAPTLIAGALPDRVKPTHRPRGHLLWDLGTAAVFSVFLSAAISAWMKTGSPLKFGVIVVNVTFVVLLLVRARPAAVSHSWRNWILAPLATCAPLFLRPAPADWALLTWMSAALQAIGLAIVFLALLSLGRSFGIVAANRGVRRHGLYAWVRHPLYAGEIVCVLGILLAHWTLRSAALVLAFVLAQVLRSYQEERLLIQDQGYAAYRIAVPYRLIPGIY